MHTRQHTFPQSRIQISQEAKLQCTRASPHTPACNGGAGGGEGGGDTAPGPRPPTAAGLQAREVHARAAPGADGSAPRHLRRSHPVPPGGGSGTATAPRRQRQGGPRAVLPRLRSRRRHPRRGELLLAAHIVGVRCGPFPSSSSSIRKSFQCCTAARVRERPST